MAMVLIATPFFDNAKLKNRINKK